MYPLGIVEDKIVHELAIELIRLLQQRYMVINKLLLNGSVEPLHVRVHLRGLGIGMEMGEMNLSEFFRKMFLELTAVVSQDKKKLVLMRKDLAAEVKELGSSEGGMALRAPGKRKSRIDILKGDHIPTATIYKSFNGVQSHQMSRVDGSEILRFSQDFLTISLLCLAEVRNFLWEDSESSQIMNEVTYGSGFETKKLLRYTKWQKQRIKLLSP